MAGGSEGNGVHPHERSLRAQRGANLRLTGPGCVTNLHEGNMRQAALLPGGYAPFGAPTPPCHGGNFTQLAALERVATERCSIDSHPGPSRVRLDVEHPKMPCRKG